MHFLPGEDPHVDDALMNHLILKCVWRSRGLIVGLSKTKNKQKKISNWKKIKKNKLNNAVCWLLKRYLARRKKSYKQSHPCYWYSRLFQFQMFEVLMEQPTNPSIKDRKKAESIKKCKGPKEKDTRHGGFKTNLTTTKHQQTYRQQQPDYLTSSALYASRNRFLPLMLQ